MLRLWFFSAGLWLLAPRCGSSSARLYTEEDPLVILSGGSFSPSVTNSSSAWFIQFYSSWCGHCIQYSETWKNLARDVQVFPGSQSRDGERDAVQSSVELLPLLGQRSDHYTAIIVEEPDSYVGREFSGVQVKRALSSDLPLLDALKITAFPSVYLLQPNASHTHLQVQKRLRFFFSSVLRVLPGVQRRVSSTAGDQGGALQERESIDLLFITCEGGAGDPQLPAGEELQVFKDLVTLVSKLYPGGGSVVKLMETLSDWLVSLPLPRIPYQAVLDLVDNTMRISGVFLGAELRWVGCQGSRAGLRGLQGEAAVLHVMRRYITTFFGCEACGRHFEQAAAESLQTVKSCEQQLPGRAPPSAPPATRRDSASISGTRTT
ncbi:Sulfhydryl oxidase 2, partial [Dissostichus eleginoides]